MSTGDLDQKRILVTDIDSVFGKDIANALIVRGALVFTLVKECSQMKLTLKHYPQLTPILLNVCRENCEDQARTLILSLPQMDHFINLSGDSGLQLITICCMNAKIHHVSDTETKPVISKMIESEDCPLIFNVTFRNQGDILSEIKAKLHPRFQNSKTSQVSSSLRKRFRKLFSSGTTETIDHQANSTNNSLNSQDTASPRKAPTNNSAGIQEGMRIKNGKVREKVLKLQKQCVKKWTHGENQILKRQRSALKSLHEQVEQTQDSEMTDKMMAVWNANEATMSRADGLTAETAIKIAEARENRAIKEVEKCAKKTLAQGKIQILRNAEIQLVAYNEKLYDIIVKRQIFKFNCL